MTRPTPFVMLCLMLSSLSACASLPEQGLAARPVTDPAPDLVPIEGILQQADALQPADAATDAVETRAAALRTRAARLRPN